MFAGFEVEKHLLPKVFYMHIPNGNQNEEDQVFLERPVSGDIWWSRPIEENDDDDNNDYDYI